MTEKCDEHLKKLTAILDRLRGPDGCLWDRRQKKEDVGKYLIEEAYEVIDAIEDGSYDDIREELGDVLFQILFLAKIAEEEKRFDINGVIDEIAEKMVRRHPHVFGNSKVKNVGEIKANWQDIKMQEEGKRYRNESILDGIPRSLPALLRAEKVTRRASKVGFDWPDMTGVLDKIEEELDEFRKALESGRQNAVKEEIGDILFSLVNLSRFANVDPDGALRSSTKKFTNRFNYIENKLKEQGRTLSDASLEEMDILWEQSKTDETKGEDR